MSAAARNLSQLRFECRAKIPGAPPGEALAGLSFTCHDSIIRKEFTGNAAWLRLVRCATRFGCAQTQNPDEASRGRGEDRSERARAAPLRWRAGEETVTSAFFRRLDVRPGHAGMLVRRHGTEVVHEALVLYSDARGRECLARRGED